MKCVNTLKEAGVVSGVLGMLVYLNTLDCGMVFDDDKAILWNQDIRPATPWKQLLVHDFWGTSLTSPLSHKSYRPLCVATFKLNYLVHGLAPMGYHLVNVLLHGVVCYLYVQLCGVIFSEVWPALIAGLLFAVHPIHTEAVAGIVGRAELLSGIFFISSFLVYRKALLPLTQGCRVNWLLVSLSVGLGVMSMLSKEQGITSLALCLLYDFFIFNKLNVMKTTKHLHHTSPKSDFTRLRAFFVRGVVISAAVLVTLVMRLLISNGAPSDKVITTSVNPPLSQRTPYRQLSWLYLTSVNIHLLLSPSKLSIDWRYDAVPLIQSLYDQNNITTFLTALTLIALTLYSFWSKEKNNRVVLFALSLMALPFLPASNLFFPVGFVVAERVLYLPSMGFCMLVAYGISLAIQKTETYKPPVANLIMKCVLVYMVALFSLKTVYRNRDWYSETTVYKAGLKFNPSNPIFLSNLGIEYAIKEDYSQAEVLYLASMRSCPTYPGSYYNYGTLMNVLHRFEEAEQPLLKAIELGGKDALSSKRAEIYDMLATAISKNSSRLKEALELSEHVLAEHPKYGRIYTTRCSILIKLNRTSDFISKCKLAVQISPGFPPAHYNLGVAYMKLGYLAQAETTFRNLLSVERGSILGMFHLATVLQTTGRTQDLLESRELWRHITSMQPNNIQALMNLADVDSSLHHYSKALDTLQKVLLINPHHQGALYRAGELLYRRGQDQEARPLLNKLKELNPNHTDVHNLLNKIQQDGTLL